MESVLENKKDCTSTHTDCINEHNTWGTGVWGRVIWEKLQFEQRSMFLPNPSTQDLRESLSETLFSMGRLFLAWSIRNPTEKLPVEIRGFSPRLYDAIQDYCSVGRAIAHIGGTDVPFELIDIDSQYQFDKAPPATVHFNVTCARCATIQ